MWDFSNTAFVEITAGAFWKKLPDTITYEATIPLSYETEWVETTFPTSEEKDVQCYDTADEGICATHYQFKALTKAFAEETRLLDNTYRMYNMRETNGSRRKRALDFIGEGFSWCCGLATDQKLKLVEEDEASVRRRLDTITETISSSLQSMTQDTAQFRRYEEQVRSTFQETERRLKFMGSHLRQIQQKAGKADQQFQGLGHTLIHNDFSAFKHNIVIARLLRKQAILSACQDHKLPSSIVDPSVLKADLAKLTTTLYSSQQELAISVTDIFRYYKLPLAECSFTTSKLFILLKVPIRRTQKQWELFELVTVPFAWYNQTCSIPHRPLYLAANKLTTFSAPETRQISGMGLHQCKPYHDTLCHLSRFPPEALEGPECAKILFTGGTITEISQHCPINCNPSTHMVISEVLEDTYVVTHPAGPLAIKCGTNRTVLPSTYHHQGALKIRLQCSCHLESGNEVLIPSRFPCLSSDYRSGYTHIIPGIWSNFRALVLTIHGHREPPVYANMAECLNTNWSMEIPHLNITYQEETLKELQEGLARTHVTLKEDENTRMLIIFLTCWSVIASLVIVFMFARQNQLFVLLTATRPTRAENSDTGMKWDHIHMGILWLCTVALSAILIYYCVNGIGKRIVQWYESRKSRRAQPSNGNTENIPLDPPVSHHDNLGFVIGSTPICTNCSTNASDK
ncbi:hypothetical protein ABEB36_012890 [Hypothenemus hampei]|uniref:Envelope protein n=1 Tax=Hypothenemus hampei TaxID=57062 RepID=A0ABD1E6Y8_HYPHA